MLWRYFHAGGFMMWPLLMCSILLVMLLVERVWSLGVLGAGRKGDKPASGTRRGLPAGRLGSQGGRVRLHRRVLPFFTDVPPSLGLLGTVIGVVQSFNLVDGKLNSDAVGAGLAVACLTTVFGLSIAITATISGYVFDWWERS